MALEMSPVIEFEDLGDFNICLVSEQFAVIAVAVLGVLIWGTSFPPFHDCLISFHFFTDKLGSTN